MIRKLPALAAPLCCSLLVAGCAQFGYYAHLARGQWELMSRREPIADVIADPRRDKQLRARLALVQDARHFAVTDLQLPDNASYTSYADLQRGYAVWNVLATPEFSLAPLESCFPIVGCLAYRGHYRRESAEVQAKTLRAQGYDVDIGGVPAYSTLGWFDDPVLNTMMRWSDAVLVATVFHELAHQRQYITDDTLFNESMARFVEQQGLREYLAAGRIDETESALQRSRESDFTRLMLNTRERLAELYRLPLSPDLMRQRKADIFAQLQSDYARMRDMRWNGYRGYDRWFARELNNASLLNFGLYDEFLPAFEYLYDAVGRDWSAFHVRCEALAALPLERRRQQMRALMQYRRHFDSAPQMAKATTD